MSVQTKININPAYGVDGDFASLNPIASAISPVAAYRAGLGGVLVGTFCWASLANEDLVINSGTGSPVGFVPRVMQALVTNFLSESSMLIPIGYEVTAIRSGDFQAINNGSASVTGQAVFANINNGSILSAAAGSIIANYVETGFFIALSAAQGELTIISGEIHANGTPTPPQAILLSNNNGAILTNNDGVELAIN